MFTKRLTEILRYENGMSTTPHVILILPSSGLKMVIAEIPIFSELFEYTKNFLGELCGLIGLIVCVVAVNLFFCLYRKRKKRGK